jgi:uroporphyrin-III C-methyltransferase/precorrin-2 dehydrogenase/sirohydrochlorin ferrochelatase/uroporphyrin-III C-methyltransferase
MQAKVFLVGAGPGDPELLTVKAARLLGAAEIVLHDSLVDARILGLAARAELIDVGKRCGKASTAQGTINELLVGCARTGRVVVRLKGGDPMVFGRATEEMAALAAAGIGFEVVPGVSAAMGAAASLGVSLTQRRVARSVHFLTGHGAEGGLPAHDWVALAQGGGTLVVYMGGQTLGGLAAHFIEAGMRPELPAVAVENASLAGERVWAATIASLPRILEGAKPAGPVLLMIGEAVAGKLEGSPLADVFAAGQPDDISRPDELHGQRRHGHRELQAVRRGQEGYGGEAADDGE